MEPTINEALEHEQIFMHNPTLGREYEAREKAVRDELSRLRTANEEGREEGIQEERTRQEQKHIQQQLAQLRHMMQSISVDLEQAMAILGMSDEDKSIYRTLMKS